MCGICGFVGIPGDLSVLQRMVRSLGHRGPDDSGNWAMKDMSLGHTRLAIIDPILTLSVPPDITASTGLDALTQLIEPFVCNNPNPLTDAICRAGMDLCARSIKQAYRDGEDLSARQDMSLAALLSGMALANARLGGVHGFAGVLGGTLGAPHGAICARLLPIVMDVNIRALAQRQSEAESLSRYDEVARILTGIPEARTDDGVAWIEATCAELNILPLTAYGLQESDYPLIIEKTAKSSSMKGNPIVLAEEEQVEILDRAR